MNIKFDSYLPALGSSKITVDTSELFKKFKDTIANEDIGFFDITQRQEYIESTQSIYEEIKHKKYFIQIGIGGSALGPQMLVSSLGKATDKKFFLLDNTDSEYISDILKQIDFTQSVFYVVSKSGGTAETIACYSIVRNLLKKNGIDEKDFNQYFIFCTDKTEGQLRDHVDKYNYKNLEVPADVGGRFSVLTPVGLLPALFMGIDIHKLFEGAENYKTELLNENLESNPLVQTAESVLKLSHACPMTVFMPYSSKLKELSFWFVQLWAESLGKYSAANQRSVGLTPIPAYGATDQHSQVQLFMEGPNDKLLFLLHLKSKNTNFKLDSGLDFPSASKLSAFTMNDLIEAEYKGTVKALQENERNIITMEIAELNEESLGQLVLFFECLTAITGLGLLIDPFNQPGVEKGKKYAFEYLNSLRK